MDFERWKALPPVMNVAKELSFGEELALCNDWNDYTRRFVSANGDDGQLIKASRRFSKKSFDGRSVGAGRHASCRGFYRCGG